MTTTEPSIRVDGLRFGYDGAEVLHGISFELHRGQVTGLLGPNGAGKSTTLKILTCILQAREGLVTIEGFEVPKQSDEVKKRLGYVPESADLYETLSALEFLELCGRLHEIEENTLQHRIDVFLETFGLSGQKRSRLGSFQACNGRRSSGVRRRRIRRGAKFVALPGDECDAQPASYRCRPDSHVQRSVELIQQTLPAAERRKTLATAEGGCCQR